MVKLSVKQTALNKLREKIVKDKVCPELAVQAAHLVMGDGNLDADIMIIGEAPGKKEDEQGLPFVGAAGSFLNEMLAQAGMLRSDVYITNIVKYRPPDNRDPSKEEKLAFLPYLIEQLKIIHPKAIITLGRHSMECLLPDKKISDVHGQQIPINIDGWHGQIIPLYHPAVALYNGSNRQQLIDEFITANRAIKGS